MTQALEEAPIRRPQSTGGRVPPHNLDAEESLIGAMLLTRDATAAAVEFCTSEDFYKPAHAHIFGAITSSTPGGTGRRGHGGRRAAPVGDDRSGGRSRRPHVAAGVGAVDGQRLLLRQDRRGARLAPASHHGGW